MDNSTGGGWNIWDTALVTVSAFLGVAARLAHTFSQRSEYYKKHPESTPPKISIGEAVAAFAAAPALGIIAGGFGDYLNMSQGAIYAMAGFAGLSGPSLLLSFWDKIIEPYFKKRAKDDN